MGAAWRDLKGRKSGFKRILDMVEGVRAMDMEVCVTLGMLDADQARQLKDVRRSGPVANTDSLRPECELNCSSTLLTTYGSSVNHNLDTSREHYPKVISTRTFDERLKTIEHVRNAGISVCSGGIIGLGEAPKDRVGLIWEMSQLVRRSLGATADSSQPEPPESFPGPSQRRRSAR